MPLSSLAAVGSCSCIRPSISGTGQCGMNETVLVTIGLTATKGAFSQVATVTCKDDQSDARTNAASFLVEMKTFPPIHASAKVVSLRQPETDRIRLVSAAPDLVTLGKEIELLSDFISIADIDVTDGEGLKVRFTEKETLTERTTGRLRVPFTTGVNSEPKIYEVEIEFLPEFELRMGPTVLSFTKNGEVYVAKAILTEDFPNPSREVCLKLTAKWKDSASGDSLTEPVAYGILQRYGNNIIVQLKIDNSKTTIPRNEKFRIEATAGPDIDNKLSAFVFGELEEDE